jgi:hypothetical protein
VTREACIYANKRYFFKALFEEMDVTDFFSLTIRLHFCTFSLFNVVSGIQDYMTANVYKIFSE